MNNKWRVTIYKGLRGIQDNPKILDEVHVSSHEELDDDEVHIKAIVEMGFYPKTHHVDIVRIK